jgi:hypothetical protein
MFDAQQQSHQPVFSSLLAQLESPRSQLNGQYRLATVHALARWYNAGRPEKDSDDRAGTRQTADRTNQPDFSKAQAEHEELYKQLDTLCFNDQRVWLRSAACKVWVEAYLLRKEN